MITSVIRHRVADFLKQHAPFDAVSQLDLIATAGSGKVKFHESEEYLFRGSEPQGGFVWVIQQGRVELIEESEGGEQLQDVLGAGDIPGLEALIAGKYRYSARTGSDVILYGVPAERFESLVASYPEVQRFVAAHVSLSGNLGFSRSSWLESDFPPAEYLRSRLVTIRAGTAAGDAAKRLAESGTSLAAVVDEQGRAVGAITALDLLQAQGSGYTGNVPAVPLPPSTRGAVREMLRSRSEQFVLTEDGTAGGRVQALVTSSELALFCGHDPARLIRSIRQAATVAEIPPLMRRTIRTIQEGVAQPRDTDDGCRIGREMVRAVCESAIRMGDREVQASDIRRPDIRHCWVVFGAAARGELLDSELPTIAVLYDDSDPGFKPEDRIYFAGAAGEALARLHACGLKDPGWQWPHGAQPGMPVSEWKRLYSETIRTPLGHDLYARRQFFDLAPLTGDPLMVDELKDHIRSELAESGAAIALLANDTLANLPPLAFFQGLVLDLQGASHHSLDIGSAVISPLANAARVFAVSTGRLSPAGTIERLEAALADYPDHEALLCQAADAFRVGLYYNCLAGGGLIAPGRLGKFDQLVLKSAFAAIKRFLEFTVSEFVPGE